jgi:SAM-dependent methyltransferase
MSWFFEWFNSPYYHILYKNRNYKEAEKFINNLVQNLKIKENSNVIDIACGSGRHAIHLNKLGLNVIGVDISKNSIANAKKYENNKLKFYIHDIRKVFLPKSFDLAVNLFTSFGYFNTEEEDQIAINSISRNLKERGTLVIDFMNVKKVIPNLVLSEERTIEGIKFSLRRKFKNNFITKDIKFKHLEKEYSFQEKVKAIDLNKFSELINKSGLKIINIFGDYSLGCFNEEQSDRLILICKK